MESDFDVVRTPVEVSMWLKENGLPADVCDVFEGL